MLVLLSPAKKIAQHPVQKGLEVTQPVLLDEADYLMKKLKTYSVAKIKKLMGVSDDIARLNYGRYQDWKRPLTEKNAWMAAYSFDGSVYWGLDVKSLTNKQVAWSNDHLRILSGLYGLLRPTDLMIPYRLEMGTRMQVTKVKNNLYKYWGDTITDLIEEEIKSKNHKCIVNLASNEYFKSVKAKNLSVPVITPLFKDFSKGEYKSLMTYAKFARGLMSRYIIKNKIRSPEKLKGFDYEGYYYNDQLSDGDTLVFTRDKVPGKLK